MNRIILTLIIALLMPFTTNAKIYLVSAGITDYPGTDMDLHVCANDARCIKQLYDKNSAVESIVLLNKQATKENIISSMRSLFKKASARDIVVFYYSGHGVAGGLQTYNGILTYQRIRNAYSESNSKNKMMFIDACFAGDIRRNKRDTSAQSKQSNVMLFLSSRGTETSLEDPKLPNSIFTYSLINGLKGLADVNRDRTVTAKELFDYVSADVQRRSNREQHPVMWGNFSKTMPVMVW